MKKAVVILLLLLLAACSGDQTNATAPEAVPVFTNQTFTQEVTTLEPGTRVEAVRKKRIPRYDDICFVKFNGGQGWLNCTALLVDDGVIVHSVLVEDLVDSALPTLAPTAKPIPTATRWPSRHTPRPPRPNPETNFDIESAIYAESVVSIAEEYVEVVGPLEDLFIRSGYNPMLIFDDEWRLDVMLHLILLEGVTEKLRALKPTSAMQPIHDELMLSADDTESAIGYFSSFLDSYDVSDLENGTEAFNRASAHLSNVTGIAQDIEKTINQ